MSSAMPRDPDAARHAANDAADSAMARGGKHMRLTARQQELNTLWSYFRVAEHDGKGVDWSGDPIQNATTRDMISRQGYLDPGFETTGDILPRKYRRPATPLGVVHTIVSRFTGLLFSNRRHPRVTVPGDENTEDYLGALLKVGAFWATMARARNFGGAMGSVAVGFRFIRGRVTFEALDPRWCTPEFASHDMRDLIRLTIQYTYPVEEKDEQGQWKKTWYWYRRVVDTQTDTVWVRIKCRDGKEPRWEYMQHTKVEHGLGFVPYEWVANLRADDDIDGDADCLGCYDLVDGIDQLLSEVWSGTLQNCDPSLLLTTDEELSSIKKGSDNAIRLGKGESANYLELQGAGPRVGLEIAKALEDRVFRLAQCVPDNVLFEGTGEKTATEIERIFSSMLEKADMLREQYGAAVTSLCQKLIAAVRVYTEPRLDENGQLVRGKILVPPRIQEQTDGDAVEVPRVIGKGTLCEIRWPPYYRPSLTDIEAAIRLSTMAKDSMVLTKSSTVGFFAPFMDIDPLKELNGLKREEAEAAEVSGGEDEEGSDEEEADDTGDEGSEEEGTPEGGTGSSSPAAAQNPAAWKAALESGVITLNEYREMALGLGAIPDGDLTLFQYRAKYAEVTLAATATTSNEAVKALVGDGGTPTPGGGPPSAEGGTSPSAGPPKPPPPRPRSAPSAPASGPEAEEGPEPPQDDEEPSEEAPAPPESSSQTSTPPPRA